MARARNEEVDARAAALVSEAEARAAEMRSRDRGVLGGATPTRRARGRRDRRRGARHRAARCSTRRRRRASACSRISRAGAACCRRRSRRCARGRDSLLDAYRVVKRSFLEATGALSQVEERAAAERPRTPRRYDGTTTCIELAAELAPNVTEPSDRRDRRDVEADRKPSPRRARLSGTATARRREPVEGDAGLADVDSLFARIRAGQAEVTIEPRAAPAPAESAGSADAAAQESEPSEPVAAAAPGTAAPEPAGQRRTRPSLESRRVARRAGRTVLDPLLVTVAKRAKRAAQDDQNALLDAVRRHKGRPTSAQVLVPEAGAARRVGRGRHATRSTRPTARDGWRSAAETAGADDALVDEAAETIVMPLRERIASAIDAGEEGDTGGLVERIGARFREWKNQSLEESLDRRARLGVVARRLRRLTRRRGAAAGSPRSRAAAPTATTTDSNRL